MPDPLLYLAAIGASALAAALLGMAIAWRAKARQGEKKGNDRSSLATVAGMAGGLIAGYWVLDLHLSWPPVNALDRLLTIILPMAVGIELIAAFERVPRWLAWTLRVLLVFAMGRILLHGSVYITGDPALLGIVVQLIVCAALVAALWSLLTLLAVRSQAQILISTVLALTMIVSGGLIMVSGYVSGGAATLPLSSSLVATVVTSVTLTRNKDIQGPLGITVVGLSGLLFIGRYFGGLSAGMAVLLLLAPLLCWIVEAPALLRRWGVKVTLPP
jgi:hypothetical protein